MKYFVYNATSDITSWYSQSNLIDSSYYNAISETAQEHEWGPTGLCFFLCFFRCWFFSFFFLNRPPRTFPDKNRLFFCCFLFFHFLIGCCTRSFTAVQFYGGCGNDRVWMLISDGTDCSIWEPYEGSTKPDIRYSINRTVSGLPTDGNLAVENENDVADTFVIYLNVDNSSTFGLTNDPTNFPTSRPSSSPTIAPSFVFCLRLCIVLWTLCFSCYFCLF